MNKHEPELIHTEAYSVLVERTSRRKTASIKVDEGEVIIIVPKLLQQDKIDKILVDKRSWIVEKLALYQATSPATIREYVSGESLPYLGRNYRLKVLTGDLTPTKLLNGRITVTVPEPSTQSHYVRRALVKWYKRHADKKIREKVWRYESLVGVETGVVRTKEFKSRWGSCTPYGDLEFNWVIVMAPNRVVDYVVVHELCHLIHHDHSPQFWKEVERVMPDYKEHKDWLREYGHGLSI
ncbi:M48 family metallopeptidase [Vibrio algarum]|uniref:SprT family zinc-dependent metalloprotease n=1 Tax=Vibrio algarum TaxID=3020714 RepID=A0ABT4YSY5_9VIBR|nr:SprT family zinc-dependent metalloprotease [Vibrio sp. KJ40-1]MDB1124677.1 SprT family zinc-dependent metalloprotease [Vibrio sp. KJ40-1]